MPSSPPSPERGGAATPREIRPAGEAALLVTAEADAPELAAAIRAAGWPGISDVIPGAATVLVITEPAERAGGAGLAGLADQIRALRVPAPESPQRDPGSGGRVPGAGPGQRAEPGRGTEPGSDVIEIPVCYDGPDLADVAALTGLSVDQVIERHQAAVCRVGWMGFAPGFGYLTGLDPALAAVPRLTTPRQAIPAGSVAIAGGLAAVYPTASPGGWRLLGRTTAPLWDVQRDPPALLAPGQRVRFRAVSAAALAGFGLAGGSPDAASSPGAAEAGNGAPDAAWLTGTGPVEVIRPGVLTTVQDLGRPGYGHLGVPRSGAADPASLRRANALVGNEPGAAALEFTAGRAELRFHAPVVVAATGSAARPGVLTIRPDGGEAQAVPPGRALAVPARSVLRLDQAAGPRGYLAIAGGIDAPPVLGSRSADLLSGLGPRPLEAGDRLLLGVPGPAPAERPEAEPPGWPSPALPTLALDATGPPPAAGDSALGGNRPDLGSPGLWPNDTGAARDTTGAAPATAGSSGGSIGPAASRQGPAEEDAPPARDEFGRQAPGTASPPAGAPAAAASAPDAPPASRPAGRAPVTLAVVLGPRDDWFSPAALAALRESTYRVTPASNRVGLRLSGPGLGRERSGELPSEGLVSGAIQVPPDGQPILMLADHPVTGGYPVIAVATAEAVSAAAHLRPGDLVRFTVRGNPL